MRKFDETLHSDQDWQHITISGKWTPVIIESNNVVSYKDTISMIMRIDPMFDPHYPYAGNDSDWRNFCREYTHVPEEIPFWIRNYHEWTDDVNKEWGRNFGLSDSTIFDINLFSSSYIGGPYSFVNYKTGKVGLIKNIGKWPESVGGSEEELKWFTETYPQYKFFVTFCDNECWGEEKNTKALCTLMLYNGEIKRVTTRQYKDWKYCYNINHLKGSTCAKNSVLKRLIWDKTNLWKITSRLPKLRDIRRWFCENIAKDRFINIWNNYVMDHNYRIMNMDHEKYFDKKHAMAIMDEWLDSLRETKKNSKEKEDE